MRGVQLLFKRKKTLNKLLHAFKLLDSLQEEFSAIKKTGDELLHAEKDMDLLSLDQE